MSARPSDPLFGKIITVLGGSGFVGRHVAQELLARGARLRIASRNPEKAYAVRLLGNLGQVQFARVDLTNADSVARAVAGANAVVNLVGTFTGKVDAVQGKGAGTAAAAAKAAGVAAFVHVSVIGADAGSSIAYTRSKGEGEAAVRAAFPEATIVRPSIVFGPDDKFLMMFGDMIGRMPVMPVFAPEAKLQPVFVDDVAEAIANAIVDPELYAAKTFELAGPEVLTMLELTRRIAQAEGRPAHRLLPLPDGIAGLLAALPMVPISGDQIKLLKAGNVASGTVPGLADIGVQPRPLELFLDRWMTQFRKHGRFGTKDLSAA